MGCSSPPINSSPPSTPSPSTASSNRCCNLTTATFPTPPVTTSMFRRSLFLTSSLIRRGGSILLQSRLNPAWTPVLFPWRVAVSSSTRIPAPVNSRAIPGNLPRTIQLTPTPTTTSKSTPPPAEHTWIGGAYDAIQIATRDHKEHKEERRGTTKYTKYTKKGTLGSHGPRLSEPQQFRTETR